MNIIKFLICTLIVAVFIVSLSSCGVNSPTTTSTINNNSTVNSTSPTISAYMSPVHANTLTSKAIDIVLSQGNLTSKQKTFLIKYRTDIEKGARLEDEELNALGVQDRPLNHFWDPYHDVQLSDPPMTYNSSIKAIVWAQNDNRGHMYYVAKEKFQKSIGFYDPTNSYNATDIEFKNSMENLGRTLHLLQDMTSPPHVRNDAHPPFV